MADQGRARSVRFGDEEFAAIEAAAERSGKSAHAWMRDALLVAARRSPLLQQLTPLAPRGELPAGLTPAFDEVAQGLGHHANQHNWLFIFEDSAPRAHSIVGHLREVGAAAVTIEVFGSNSQIVIPRARIIAWEHLVGHNAHDPATKLLRWQDWGARAHRSMKSLRRETDGFRPPWPAPGKGAR